MTYRVTQQDIDAGLPNEPRYCPVAKAIQRRHQTKRVYVGTYMANIGDSQKALPRRITRWICEYDLGRDVMPIRFEL